MNRFLNARKILNSLVCKPLYVDSLYYYLLNGLSYKPITVKNNGFSKQPPNPIWNTGQEDSKAGFDFRYRIRIRLQEVRQHGT